MKKINLFLIIIASLGGICYSIIPLINAQIYKFLICLAIIPVMLVPNIVKKVLKIKITPTTEFIYLIFVFCAHFLGSIVNLYHLINNYDKIMHLASGIVTAFFGILIMVYLKKYNKKSIIFNVLFIISFVLMVASFWEFFEYFCDNLFSKDAQNVLTTGVNDTMNDMIAAFIGAILFNIMYIYEEIADTSLVIKRFIKEIEKD